MKSIAGNTTVEFIEKKSRFIGIICHVESVDEVNHQLAKSKSDYPNANHYTYAYILDDNSQKYSDDGEPTRTAGYPILEIIKNNQLNFCLLIVIRYFGGIMLGTGGLVRAYSHTAALAVEGAPIAKKIITHYCKVTCDYDYLGNIDRIVREKTDLDNVIYDNKVTFFFSIIETDLESIKTLLFNNNNYQDNLEIIESIPGFSKINC